MRPARARLFACALAASVVLGSVVASEPALAATSATCAEPHAAKVARKALRAAFKTEATTFATATDNANRMLAKAQAAQTTVLADATSTDSAKGIAAADVAYPTRALELTDAAKTALEKDRAKLSTCGLPAMRRLTARVTDRELTYVIDVLTAFKTQGQAYLKWDTVTRDGAAAGSEEYTTAAKHVTADETTITSITRAIRSVRKQLS